MIFLSIQPEKLSGSQELEELMQLDADLIVTAAYGQFLPTKFFKLPTFWCGERSRVTLTKISWRSSNPLCNYERGQRNWRNNYANGCEDGCGCDYFTNAPFQLLAKTMWLVCLKN